MDFKGVMGWDEHEDLFVSGKSSSAKAGTYQVSLDGKEDKAVSVLKKTVLSEGKEENGKGVRAMSNGLPSSLGIVSNESGESGQTVSTIGLPVSNDITEGSKGPEEATSNVSEDLQRKLDTEVKIGNYDSSLAENYFSVFIGNLPPFANNRWIFDNFVKIGKVVDYFKSGRLTKFNKNHFGFVRFRSLEDANKAVEHFNGSWVDGYKLEVDLARYPKRSRKDEDNRFISFSREEQRCLSKGSYDGLGHSDSQKAWLNPNKTFAQILVGNNDVNRAEVGISNSNRIKVKAKAKDCDWLKRSVVAKIKWGSSMRDIKKKLLPHVKGLKAVSRLGIRKVILSFVSLEDRNYAIISEDWRDCVEDVREWNGELVCNDKLWDMSCTGIPIIAWNIETFRSIAEIWGSLVYINEDIVQGDDFRMANFVIESVSEIKNSIVELLVDNNVFQVKVEGSMLENQDGQLSGFENAKWINEGDGARLDTNYLFRLNNMNPKVSVVKPDGQDQICLRSHDNAPEGRIPQCMIENNVVDGKRIEESEANTTDGNQNFERFLECTVEERSLHTVESRYDLKNHFDMAPNDTEFLGKRCEEVAKGVNQNSIRLEERQTAIVEDQVNILAVGSEMQSDPIKVCLSSGHLNSYILEDRVEDGENNLDRADFSMGKAEYGKCSQIDEVGLKILSESTNNQQNSMAVKLPAASLEDDNAKSGLNRGVEKEVNAMLELGKLLDIPNVHQFEGSVRDTTAEDLWDEPSSIGGRVKSKRKYAGKSKVHFGGRAK